MAGSLEARMGNIEELCIIIIIIVLGGGRLPGHGPVGDSAAGDTSRMEALMRIVRGGLPGIIPDPGPPDLARLSLEVVESRLLAVNAELDSAASSGSGIERPGEGTARRQIQVAGSRLKTTEGRLLSTGGLLVRRFHAVGSSDRLPGPG